MAKIEVFSVKNDALGRKFIRELRKYLNRTTYAVRVRGRHANRKKLYRELGRVWDKDETHDVQIKHAESFGIYLDVKPGSGWSMITDEVQRLYIAARNNANITQSELDKLQKEYNSLQGQMAKFKKDSEQFIGINSKGLESNSRLKRKVKIK